MGHLQRRGGASLRVRMLGRSGYKVTVNELLWKVLSCVAMRYSLRKEDDGEEKDAATGSLITSSSVM